MKWNARVRVKSECHVPVLLMVAHKRSQCTIADLFAHPLFVRFDNSKVNIVVPRVDPLPPPGAEQCACVQPALDPQKFAQVDAERSQSLQAPLPHWIYMDSSIVLVSEPEVNKQPQHCL
eukprot:TRINITY_DN27700_c0_g1_i2.p2 TRINITY_DN27700_c0_g1~~TRINITY_DN27700_c0_g1_i2.p2  ORF type:complete len:119 (-),score=9.66 TRINITY_DN27700_c0_g1_i2:431-787(-)